MKIKWFSLLPLIMTLLAFFLRIWNVSSAPPSLYWDEAAMGVDGYFLANQGVDMNFKPGNQAIFYSYGDYKAPVYIWLVTLSEKIFGHTIGAVRLPSILAGTVSVYLVYLIAYQLFRSPPVALWSQLLMAISPWALQFSRGAFESNVALFWTLLAVYLLLKSRKIPYLTIGVAVAAAAAVYSYFSARIVVPLIVIHLFSLMSRREQKKLLRWGMMAAILFAGLLIPLAKSPDYIISNQFRLSNNNLLTTTRFVLEQNENRHAAGNSLLSRFLYHRHIYLIKAFADNLLAHFGSRYLFFTGDSNLRHGTGYSGIMLPATLPLFIIGIYTLLRNHVRLSLALLGWWFLALIPAAIVFEVPHSLRTLAALPVTVMVLGYGAMYFKKYWWLLGLTIGLNFCFYFHDYLIHYPVRSAEAWQYSSLKLAETLKQLEPTYEQIVLPPLYNYQLYHAWVNRERGNDKYITVNAERPEKLASYNHALAVLTPHIYQTAFTQYPVETTITTLNNEVVYYLIKL